jgi:hypothetical protein
VANAKATGSCAGARPGSLPPARRMPRRVQGCDVNDRAAFRTAAAICVVLCLIWDLATVVLLIVLPLQLAAIGLLYWGADGLVGSAD